MKQSFSYDKLLDNAKKIHMIGIGGSGMCPLAEILYHKGYLITGSDRGENTSTRRLSNMGIEISIGHKAENIQGCDLVAYSAAIPDDNPELIAANELDIPTMERSCLLGAVSRKFNNVIGVCGTHGKTTVTSLITHIMIKAGLEPNALIGGRLPLTNTNGVVGSSEIFVCESCEYVDTFLQISPDIAVLLNIDNDHLEYFKTMENLTASFRKFIGFAHTAFVNGDDERFAEVTRGIKSDVITFGLKDTNDYYPFNIQKGKFGYCYDVYHNGEKIGSVDCTIPGKHNIYNSLVAFAVCYNQGVEAELIKDAISSFTGAGRRFELIGEYNGFTLVDDFAHHPTEIKATLKAAKGLEFNRVIVVFQPYTYSRTAMLKDEFIEALSIADNVILTPINAAREINTYGIDSEYIRNGLKDAVIVDGFENIADKILEMANPGDLVITMGGGDIYKSAYIIRERFI